MNSSTSDSESRRWRGVLRLYGAATLAVALSIAATLLGIDPYDTGRLTLAGSHNVPPFSPRLTRASLGRDPAFDTAIIGNSTVQLLDPSRIGGATGRQVVSLTIPGTGPLEQLAVADWFSRHHRGKALRSLILGLDIGWCRSDGVLAPYNPFPFWLYSAKTLDYAAGMMRMTSFDAAARKIRLMLGTERPAARDGYDDYEAEWRWDLKAARQRIAAGVPGYAASFAGPEPPDFAALSLLAHFLGDLPPTSVVVLVFPPAHHDGLPKPGGASAAWLQSCKDAVAALAVVHPALRLVDYLWDSDLAQSDGDFWDVMHYRASVARRIEADIAATLRDSEAAASHRASN